MVLSFQRGIPTFFSITVVILALVVIYEQNTRMDKMQTTTTSLYKTYRNIRVLKFLSTTYRSLISIMQGLPRRQPTQDIAWIKDKHTNTHSLYATEIIQNNSHVRPENWARDLLLRRAMKLPLTEAADHILDKNK